MNLAAIAASFDISLQHSEPITDGLINHTFKITDIGGKHFLLQQINTSIFREPKKVQENFAALHGILQYQYSMPAMVLTEANEIMLMQDDACWRCFSFIENSFTPTGNISEELAYTTAHCFGK